MLGLLIGILVTVLVGYLIVKNYKPHSVLIFAGLFLMLLSIILKTGTIFPEDKGTGFIFFDIFEFIKTSFSGHGANLGLIIMSVGGFARYMDYVGASRALVNITIKPLRKINAPYLVLAMGYIVGQILNIFIPSASGLGVLLMVTIYPILVELGVSPLSATAMIGTAACLDLGPASGASNLAAETSGLDATTYFMKYQLPVAVVVMVVIATLHYIVQKRFDTKEGHIAVVGKINDTEGIKEEKKAPGIYALLPIIPLILIFTFSKLVIDTISMNVITAMIIGLILTMIFEIIRYRSVKDVFKSIEIFFNGMGSQWAAVITLIVAGETFAKGLQTIGAIDTIINAAQGASLGPALMIVVMVAIISISAIVMGSGNAPFFAFAALAPDVAAEMGIATVLMAMPMQLAAGIARSVSPITSVIVAVSGISEVSTIDVVKRTAIPMAGGLIALLVASFIFI